jgi:hypothetical protein
MQLFTKGADRKAYDIRNGMSNYPPAGNDFWNTTDAIFKPGRPERALPIVYVHREGITAKGYLPGVVASREEARVWTIVTEP